MQCHTNETNETEDTMAVEQPKREYRVKDDVLLMRAAELQHAGVRHQATLADYGISAAYLVAMDEAIEQALANMSDQVMRYEVKELLEQRATVEEDLRHAIRAVITRAALVWGKDSLKYAEFRAHSVSHLHGAELGALADVVVNKAQQYLPELSASGLTEAMIDAVRDGEEQLRLAMNAVWNGELERMETTAERINHLNMIYGMMQRLSLAGKNAFANNPVAYHNFILWGGTHRKKDVEE